MKPTSKEVIYKILDAKPKKIYVFMTPKEKAASLVDRYLDEVFNETDINFPLELPSRLAIIAVNEIIKAIDWHYYETPNNEIEYWQQVKYEIERI